MLSNTQNQILYGAILRDSYVETDQGKKTTTRVRFDHAVQQLDYIEWKSRALAPYATPVREVTVFDRRTERWHKR